MPEQLSSAESVDVISRGLAASPSRRDVLRLLGSVAVGGLLGLFGTKKARATVVIENCPSCGTCKSCNFDAEGCTNTCSQACLTASLCNEAHSNQKYLQLKQYLLDQGFRQRFEPSSYEASGQAIGSSTILTTQFIKSNVLTFRKPHYLDQTANLRFLKTSDGNARSLVEIDQFKTPFALLTVSDANVIQHFPNPQASPSEPQFTSVGNALLAGDPTVDCKRYVSFLCGEIFESALVLAVCGPKIVVTPLFAACVLTFKVALYKFTGFTDTCSTFATNACVCSDTGLQIRPKCGDTCCGAYQTCCDGDVCPEGPLFVCCPDGTVSCGNVCCPRSPYVVCDPNSPSILGRCRSVCPPGTTTCGRNCCGSGQICANAATSTCGCPVTQETCGPFCCPPGKICVNPTLGTCGCPATQVSCGNACCSSGQVCDGTTCVTSCPPGKVACQGQCRDACGPNQTMDSTTCQCRCTTGFRLCNGVCCPGNQPWCHNGTCVASCPSGTTTCGSLGVCANLCNSIPGQFIDPATCQCTCGIGSSVCHGTLQDICCPTNQICTSAGTLLSGWELL